MRVYSVRKFVNCQCSLKCYYYNAACVMLFVQLTMTSLDRSCGLLPRYAIVLSLGIFIFVGL